MSIPQPRNKSINLTAIGAIMMANMLQGVPQLLGMGRKSRPKDRKPLAVMAAPSPKDLAAWNEAVRVKKLGKLSGRIDKRLKRLAPKV